MSPTGFPYLYLRGSVYYFRIRIPADLIFCFDGRREIRLSLRTKEPHLARISHHPPTKKATPLV